ncbi:GNAT family N-acetyltransferase [bacterium SCSIO 12643]|nr:GNAT family N-acetyltransferase [bacterium SCSIO 12643]
MDLEKLGYLSVGSQMRRIYEKLQIEADRLYKDINVEFRSSWFPIYYTLMQSNRALSIMEITDAISYSRITVKNVIQEMEKLEYVMIDTNPLDNRSKLVSLTPKGHVVAEKLQDVWQVIQKELEHLFNSENDMFLKQLKTINDKLLQNSFRKNILKNYYNYTVRNAHPEEFTIIGNILVDVYSKLKGFPKIEEQPEYYNMLRNVGSLTQNPNIELLVAVTNQGNIGGAVVYFSNMKDYGSGGTATLEKNACGFRLLGVADHARGLGLGKLLTLSCIEKGKKSNSKTMIIHTTKSMKLAWGMYERIGFKRAGDLDFMQGKLPVFGFRLELNK